MTGPLTQLATSPRDRFLKAAQKELTEFEQRERESTRRDKRERAAELDITALSSNLGTPDRH